MASEHTRIEMSYTGKYIPVNPSSSRPLVTQQSTPLSITKSMKTLGTKGVRSLGTFMGITDQGDKSVVHWKETWIRRVESGNAGMSLPVAKLEPKNYTPMDQLKETLSQLTQLSDTNDLERTLSGNEDLGILEDISCKRKIVQLSHIPHDIQLSPSLRNLLDSYKLNADNHKIHRTESLHTNEPGHSHSTKHLEDINCETSEKIFVHAVVHRKLNDPNKTSLLLNDEGQHLQKSDEAEANPIPTKTERQTFISATLIDSKNATVEHRRDEGYSNKITKVSRLPNQDTEEENLALQFKPVSPRQDISPVRVDPVPYSEKKIGSLSSLSPVSMHDGQDLSNYSEEGLVSVSQLTPVLMQDVQYPPNNSKEETKGLATRLSPLILIAVQEDIPDYSMKEKQSNLRLSPVSVSEVEDLPLPDYSKGENGSVCSFSPVSMSRVREDLQDYSKKERQSVSWLSPVVFSNLEDLPNHSEEHHEDKGSATQLDPVRIRECISPVQEAQSQSKDIYEPLKYRTELNSESEEEICLSQIKLEVGGRSTESSMATEEHSFVYGNEAYDHYRLFRELEKSEKLKWLKEEKHKCVESLQWQLDTLDEIATIGKDYFNNPEGKAAKRWKELQSDVAQKWNDKLALQNQLGSLPTFIPFFTYFIILAQTVSLIILCSLGGITNVGFEPQLELRENVKTFLGTETVDRLINPNPWIGPSSLYFIGVGAVYAPCMREDYQLNLYNVQRNYSANDVLGCCEIVSRNTAGTTTEQECDTLTNGVGQWRSNTVCSERVSGTNSIQHNMRPCCLGNTGACHLLSHSHCIFLGGQAHTTAEQHCSQVNCLKRVCGIGEVSSAPNRPWLPVSPDQWWRFPLSLLYSQGVIQLVIVSTGHILLTRKIEMIAGWLRVAIIFIVSGILGLTAAANFSPYEAHVGVVGGLFCMVGVALVEFLQSWKLVERPFRELAKFIFIITLFLFSGTLPHLNNAQLLTSFIAGIITAVMILPYVTFGRWHQRCRRVLVGLAAPLLLTMLFFLLFIFYNVQSVFPQNCSGCQYFECIPYTENLCKKYDFMSPP